jgi:hypothetical protein
MKWFINIVSKYLFIGEIVLFLHHKQITYVQIIRRILYFDPEKCIILLFPDSDLINSPLYLSCFMASMISD